MYFWEHLPSYFQERGEGIPENGNLKYGRVPLLQLKNPMTLCLTRMRVHLERRTVATRPRGREANPLSVVLLRCQWLSFPPLRSPPLSFPSAFVVENLLEGRLRCLWYLRDYASVPHRYSRSSDVRLSSFVVVFTSDFHRFEIAKG